ncbi:protein-L-isoaspartate O-methyltransferase [Candidatus Woesebacteria bacterium RBG_16_39_8b]|uniref:Protein-L-isoaspartate O-methyltransferase n=1 Tax=Candidatus Woesebacteria bacterium RBG_16_39_8b TaxID=1802482 RepID=A0A1F7XAN2_9BACT|nr:MAG: protein-L-isoaspartate O-methyltransferase [Candidatus Woesebacteria bacterium RBG_16_39_8b]
MIKETPTEMVRVIREVYGLESPQVLSSMLKVPREMFVPAKYRHLANSDSAIDIGYGQTISQPYTVAYMTHLLDLKKSDKVLEIGTGSGYQAAVLSILASKVFSVEINSQLAHQARERLKKLGYKNVLVKVGTGEFGWVEHAPFDAILITAQLEKVPDELFDQLNMGGRLVAPIGPRNSQVMTRYTKEKNDIKKEKFENYTFVPFILKN